MIHHRRCQRCVMDESDPGIRFDPQGLCSHCQRWDAVQRHAWMPDERGAQRLSEAVIRIRSDGAGRPYDAIIGLSGGVDSAAMAVRLADTGLRLLAVHVDGGWNSAIAVGNIERLVRHLGIDLVVHVVDWDEMRDLQLAFLRAGVPNQDIPQDHAFFARLRAEARRFGVRWFLSGHNLATEAVLPAAWGYNAMDLTHLRAIHRRFGTRPLRLFPTISLLQLKLLDPLFHRLRIIYPLDWMAYDRDSAKAELSQRLGWQDYGEKHHESRFTRFFQTWWLPTRFGYDKRLAHLSSRILSGQISRGIALAQLEQPAFDPEMIVEDQYFIARKLGVDATEFARILAAPTRRHEEFPSNAWVTRLAARFR